MGCLDWVNSWSTRLQLCESALCLSHRYIVAMIALNGINNFLASYFIVHVKQLGYLRKEEPDMRRF
jgi:hypothetical protein